MRSKIAWPARESAAPSSAERICVNSSMSAPAMKLSGLPLRITTARIAASSSISASSSSKLGDQPLAERVDLLARHVEREHEDAVRGPSPE